VKVCLGEKVQKNDRLPDNSWLSGEEFLCSYRQGGQSGRRNWADVSKGDSFALLRWSKKNPSSRIGRRDRAGEKLTVAEAVVGKKKTN